MRKQIISTTSPKALVSTGPWLDLETVARVEITSEDAAYPIELALLAEESAGLPSSAKGWRAALPGEQTVRIIFDIPQNLRMIRLVFREESETRTQELVLRWQPTGSGALREIVRQQYHFSPAGATEEVEEYRVDLQNVALLELVITPHLNGGDARASLLELRLA